MKHSIRLGLLALCVVSIPGALSLYKRRWWSSCIYFSALAYLLFIKTSQTYPPEALFVVALLIGGAHLVTLSAQLVVSAEHEVNKKAF